MVSNVERLIDLPEGGLLLRVVLAVGFRLGIRACWKRADLPLNELRAPDLLIPQALALSPPDPSAYNWACFLTEG